MEVGKRLARLLGKSATRSYEQPTPAELRLYDSLLVGAALSGLRAHLEPPLFKGLVHTVRGEHLDLASVVDQTHEPGARLPGATQDTVVLDDVVLELSHRQRPIRASAYVDDGILTSVRLSPLMQGLTEPWPDDLLILRIAHQGIDGSLQENRDEAVLSRFVSTLFGNERQPMESARDRDFAAVLGGLKLDSADDPRLLRPQESYDVPSATYPHGRARVVALHVDGSPVVVIDDGAHLGPVLWLSLDGDESVLATDLGTWARKEAAS